MKKVFILLLIIAFLPLSAYAIDWKCMNTNNSSVSRCLDYDSIRSISGKIYYRESISFNNVMTMYGFPNVKDVYWYFLLDCKAKQKTYGMEELIDPDKNTIKFRYITESEFPIQKFNSDVMSNVVCDYAKNVLPRKPVKKYPYSDTKRLYNVLRIHHIKTFK